jgi:hypothetical protein
VKVQHTLTASKMKNVTALCPSTVELDLSYNQLGDKGVASLVRALQVQKPTPQTPCAAFTAVSGSQQTRTRQTSSGLTR